jgi:WD40 repeat protein
MSSAQSLAFSRDGRALAVAGLGPVVRFWDTASGEELKPLEIVADNEASRLAFSRDGKYLATGGFGGIITVWEWSSRRQLAVLDGHDGGINALAFSPDGSSLASGDTAGLVKLRDVLAGTERTTFRAAEPGSGVTALTFSADGALLVTASYLECSVRLWNVADGALRIALPRTAVGRESTGVLTGRDAACHGRGGDGTAVLRGIAEARDLGSVRANQRGLQPIAFSGDGRVVATGGTDGYVRLWDVAQALKGGKDAGERMKD